MMRRATFIVSFLMIAYTLPGHSESPQPEPLDQERVGTIETIDRAGRMIRIDGHFYIMPADLTADPNVEYRVGDQVGYTVSANAKASSTKTLDTLMLMTH